MSERERGGGGEGGRREEISISPSEQAINCSIIGSVLVKMQQLPTAPEPLCKHNHTLYVRKNISNI